MFYPDFWTGLAKITPKLPLFQKFARLRTGERERRIFRYYSSPKTQPNIAFQIYLDSNLASSIDSMFYPDFSKIRRGIGEILACFYPDYETGSFLKRLAQNDVVSGSRFVWHISQPIKPRRKADLLSVLF